MKKIIVTTWTQMSITAKGRFYTIDLSEETRRDFLFQDTNNDESCPCLYVCAEEELLNVASYDILIKKILNLMDNNDRIFIIVAEAKHKSGIFKSFLENASNVNILFEDFHPENQTKGNPDRYSLFVSRVPDGDLTRLTFIPLGVHCK